MLETFSGTMRTSIEVNGAFDSTLPVVAYDSVPSVSTLAWVVRISIICGGIWGWRSPAAASVLIHSTTCAWASASVSSPLTAAASAAVMSRLENATSESSGAGPGSSGTSPFSAEALTALSGSNGGTASATPGGVVD